MDSMRMEDIVKIINRRYRRRVAFLIHTGLYIVAFLSAMTVPAWNRGSLFGLMLIWFVVLTIHFIWMMLAGQRDRALQREYERLRGAQVVTYEDSAAHDRLALDGDGELVDLDDLYGSGPKRKRK